VATPAARNLLYQGQFRDFPHGLQVFFPACGTIHGVYLPNPRIFE
jgi:hypothetical protein